MLKKKNFAFFLKRKTFISIFFIPKKEKKFYLNFNLKKNKKLLTNQHLDQYFSVVNYHQQHV